MISVMQCNLRLFLLLHYILKNGMLKLVSALSNTHDIQMQLIYIAPNNKFVSEGCITCTTFNPLS